MRKAVQIQGKDYDLHLVAATGMVPKGDVNIVVELYDQDPVFVNNEPNVEPVHTFHCFGDAGSFFHELEGHRRGAGRFTHLVVPRPGDGGLTLSGREADNTYEWVRQPQRARWSPLASPASCALTSSDQQRSTTAP